MKTNWPKKTTEWIENGKLYLSIPFTWELPLCRNRLSWPSKAWDHAIVGGPAVDLMPDFFNGMDNVSTGKSIEGVLQRINPMATRTTTGCVRKCKFCGIGQGAIEPGGIKCLSDWPDLPIICDNNILAAPKKHFDKVIDRLIKWEWADFNQGLDARLLKSHHAKRLAEIKKPMIRLALDNIGDRKKWVEAFSLLRNSNISRSNIRSYALIGFQTGPNEAWERCKWIESHGVKVLPMWFHELKALHKNIITENQSKLGWDNYERQKIMGWFYKHREKKMPPKNKQRNFDELVGWYA